MSLIIGPLAERPHGAVDEGEVMTWWQSGARQAATGLSNAIALSSDEVQHTATPPTHTHHPTPRPPKPSTLGTTSKTSSHCLHGHSEDKGKAMTLDNGKTIKTEKPAT